MLVLRRPINYLLAREDELAYLLIPPPDTLHPHRVTLGCWTCKDEWRDIGCDKRPIHIEIQMLDYLFPIFTLALAEGHPVAIMQGPRGPVDAEGAGEALGSRSAKSNHAPFQHRITNQLPVPPQFRLSTRSCR